MGAIMPKFYELGYYYYDESGMKIKPDAPEWAKKEYEEFMKMTAAEPDENGLVIQY